MTATIISLAFMSLAGESRVSDHGFVNLSINGRNYECKVQDLHFEVPNISSRDPWTFFNVLAWYKPVASEPPYISLSIWIPLKAASDRVILAGYYGGKDAGTGDGHPDTTTRLRGEVPFHATITKLPGVDSGVYTTWTKVQSRDRYDPKGDHIVGSGAMYSFSASDTQANGSFKGTMINQEEPEKKIEFAGGYYVRLKG